MDSKSGYFTWKYFQAEAEQMRKKAEAWKEYQDAAMVDMVLETLPKVIKHSLEVKLNEIYRLGFGFNF